MNKKTLYKNIKKINKQFDIILNKKDNFFKLRKKSFNIFNKIKFLNLKNENYKYTPISKIINNDFKFNRINKKLKLNDNKIKNIYINIHANHIILINGKFIKKYSKINNNKLYISNIDKAYKLNKKLFKNYFSKYVNYSSDFFLALNTSLFKDGIFIKLKDNVIIKKPIIIYYILNNKNKDILNYIRTFIIIGENSQITIIDYLYNIEKKENFLNIISEIILLKNSNLNYYKIQNKINNLNKIGYTQFYQSKNSQLNTYIFTLNGNVIKNNINIKLDAENCKTNIYGLYVINSNQHVDNQTVVDHIKPNSISREYYKGILNDQSTGIFNGKIYVRNDAQNTNAFQSNKNIILSEKSNIKTKPQLEILANDVKCSHGATIGQIDKNQLFYLRSRGIDRSKAISMIIKAFIKEIIEKINIKSIKNILNITINDKLKKIF